MLEGGSLGFVNISVLGYGDQGGPQPVYILQGTQYLQRQPVKIVDGNLLDAASADGAFLGTVGVL